MNEFMKQFKPMLADRLEDLSLLKFPVCVSPKLDGVRAIVLEGVVYSRSMKPIPSRYVQETFGHLKGFDGELIAGDPTDPGCFRRTTSYVMTKNGTQPVDFHVFDCVTYPLNSWSVRMDRARSEYHKTSGAEVQFVPHYNTPDVQSVARMEELFLGDGYEGAMVRSLDAPYKFGRSTVREGYLLKLKRFQDGEARVIGMQELMHNDNELQEDELGYAKRSSRQGGMVPGYTLGALVVQDLVTNEEFRIGTGFTEEDRSALWKQNPIGRIVRYRFFPTGSKDKPRFPVFAGFRESIDL